MDAWDLLDNIAQLHAELQADYGFTNIGVYPGKGYTVFWGVIYPEPTLYVYTEDDFFVQCVRSVWEELTDFGPPWPWNEDGTGLVFDGATCPLRSSSTDGAR